MSSGELDLNDLKLFALVVEHGGYAAAERASGVPKSRLSRRIAQLEEDFGVRLIQRSTRKFAVTEVGQNVFKHAQSMLAQAQAAQEAVQVLSAEPRGVVRAQWKQALHMLRPTSPNWRPPVICVSALKKEGMADFWAEVERYRSALMATGEFEEKRRKQALAWMWSQIESGLHHLFRSNPAVHAALPSLTKSVSEGLTTPGAAAMRLLGYLEHPADKATPEGDTTTNLGR